MNIKMRIYLLMLFLTLCSAYSTIVSANEKLIFSVDLIRHGDRTPEKEIPSSPYTWKEGLGELTSEGLQQEYRLGVMFRKKYIDQYHLLPEKYDAKTIYVRSTDMNRTLMSATSLLLGLYPLGSGPLLTHEKQFASPSGFQLIPVHTVPIEQDKLLTVKPNKNIISMSSMYFLIRRTWKEKSALFKDKLDAWNKATGLQINNFNQLIYIADNLYVRHLHHIPLPAGMNQNDANEIMSFAESYIVKIFKRKEMTYPMGHQFLLTVANYMKDNIQHPSELKYVLFSGHDSSIMAVMNTLGSPLNEIPYYASDLNFSLWEDKNQYFVTVTLNNKPVFIPACNGNTCTIEQFYAISER